MLVFTYDEYPFAFDCRYVSINNASGNKYVRNIENINIPFEQIAMRIDPSTIEFDMAVMDYIFANNNVFKQFMETFVYYLEDDEYVVVSCPKEYIDDDIFLESLGNIIFHRYGISSHIIHDSCDYIGLDEDHFSIQGLKNLDNDIERYSKLTVDEVIREGIDSNGDSYKVIPEGLFYKKGHKFPIK